MALDRLAESLFLFDNAPEVLGGGAFFLIGRGSQPILGVSVAGARGQELAVAVGGAVEGSVALEEQAQGVEGLGFLVGGRRRRRELGHQVLELETQHPAIGASANRHHAGVAVVGMGGRHPP